MNQTRRNPPVSWRLTDDALLVRRMGCCMTGRCCAQYAGTIECPMRQPPSQNPAPQDGLAGHALGHALSRRAVLAGPPLMLAGCVSADYGAVSDGGFVTAPIDMTTVDPSLLRQEVAWHGKE